VTADTQLIAIGIAEVCAVVVSPGSPSFCTPLAMALAWHRSTASRLGASNAIIRPFPGVASLPIVWTANEEKRPVRTWARPPRPEVLRLGELQREAQFKHETFVERKRAFEVGDTNMDV
jgi:hypothetical protein